MKQASLLWTAACLTVAACATVGLPHATLAQAVQVQRTWPDVTPQSLEQGRSLYVGKCGGCHNLIAPAARRSDDWPAWVTKMAPRARLSPEQKESIVRYLVAVSPAR